MTILKFREQCHLPPEPSNITLLTQNISKKSNDIAEIEDSYARTIITETNHHISRIPPLLSHMLPFINHKIQSHTPSESTDITTFLTKYSEKKSNDMAELSDPQSHKIMQATNHHSNPIPPTLTHMITLIKQAGQRNMLSEPPPYHTTYLDTLQHHIILHMLHECRLPSSQTRLVFSLSHSKFVYCLKSAVAKLFNQ